MRKLPLLYGAFALALAGATALWAQNTVQVLVITGNEVLQLAAGGPGGTGFFVPAYVMRNGSNYQAIATGTTVNTTVAPATGRLIATGAITTWNITLPVAPYDGQMVAVSCPGGTVTTVAVTYTPGTLSGTAFTSCTSGGAAANDAAWIYTTSNTTWNRIQ